jgi:hypothetical protein
MELEEARNLLQRIDAAAHEGPGPAIGGAERSATFMAVLFTMFFLIAPDSALGLAALLAAVGFSLWPISAVLVRKKVLRNRTMPTLGKNGIVLPLVVALRNATTGIWEIQNFRSRKVVLPSDIARVKVVDFGNRKELEYSKPHMNAKRVLVVIETANVGTQVDQVAVVASVEIADQIALKVPA